MGATAASGYAFSRLTRRSLASSFAARLHANMKRGESKMRVVNGLTGSLLVDVQEGDRASDAAEAAALALGVPRALVRVTHSQFSVVVLAGKVMCYHCDRRAVCSCRAGDDAACQCEELSDHVAVCALCPSCDDALAELQRREEAYERLQEAYVQ